MYMLVQIFACSLAGDNSPALQTPVPVPVARSGDDHRDQGSATLTVSRRLTSSDWWTITTGTGYCELANDGTCVTDGGGDYGNGESCTVRAERDLILSSAIFDTEARFDF